MALFLPILVACSGHGQLERVNLEVTLGKTSAAELVRSLGPPAERMASFTDRPVERLHFNIPFNRIMYLEIVDQNGQDIGRSIRGKNMVTFHFKDGVLDRVE
ncbi:MAG: hypothetical protein LBP92_00900 [Deltaproteobacteria bacterium]|nr:hypothetical protein [Deltaproteobacteria bacterium]